MFFISPSVIFGTTHVDCFLLVSISYINTTHFNQFTILNPKLSLLKQLYLFLLFLFRYKIFVSPSFIVSATLVYCFVETANIFLVSSLIYYTSLQFNCLYLHLTCLYNNSLPLQVLLTSKVFLQLMLSIAGYCIVILCLLTAL